jgi:predicted transcriptional regulator of viral defense system
MTENSAPPASVPLFLSSDARRDAGADRALRRSHERGQLVRLRRGVYQSDAEHAASDSDSRYDARIAAVLATRRAPVVLSHHSAARMWRLPVARDWPWQVHLMEPPDSARRSKNGVVVHRGDLTDSDIRSVAGVRVTSPGRTAIDLARDASFVDATVAIDAMLAREILTAEERDEGLDACRLLGMTRARRVIAFADGLAASPKESESRAMLHELGFPAPVLQQGFELSGHRMRWVDFWWPEFRLAGEFDGSEKYFSPEMAGIRSPREVLRAERERERELEQQHGIRFIRWDDDHLRTPSRLAALLTSAGLPRRHPSFIVPVSARSAPRAGRKAPERAQ